MKAAPRNPFIVSGKILPEYFCDRVKESERLKKEVENGNNVVLISPRRMGKTGLMYYCFGNKEYNKEYNVFFLDILQTSSLAEFTFLLGREIFRRLAPRGIKHLKTFLSFMKSLRGSIGYDPVTGNPSFNIQLGDIVNPELTIEEIFEYLASSEKPCLIAIDEFQQITTYKEKNIEAFLRGHIQRLSNTVFVFAGSERHIMQQMFTSSARPFYNSASIMELPPIPVGEYRDFACRLFDERKKKLDGRTVDIVYRLIEGHTYYLQKIFNTAFSMTSEGEECGIELVSEAIRETISACDILYRESLSDINESQKQLLVAVARDGKGESIMSADFIRRHALASASAVQSSANRLLAKDILTRTNGIYTVSDPLLRIWLLLNYTSASIPTLISD